MKKRLFILFLCVLMTAGAVFAFHASGDVKRNGTVTITREEYDRLLQYQKLDEVLQYIEYYFYKEPDVNKMLDTAVSGLLYGLEDPYTFYYDEEYWAQMQEEEEGEYTGIGLQLLGSYEDRSVTVTRIFKDTPAEAAGIRKGDLLVRVEDIEVNVETMQSAVNVMRGKVGESVEVEVYRKGEYITFNITRAEIHTNDIEYVMLDDQVGYLIIYQFTTEAFKNDFAKAMDALEKQGAKSLIIDLRDNPGGWVKDSVLVADHFLDDKLVVYSEDRFGNRTDNKTNPGASDIPLVILVNGSSASSSEILAGAMQDHKRATIMGTNTFGKGVMQYVIPLSDNKTGIQFTYCQYYTPNGNAVHGIGIKPDIEVLMPEEMASTLFEVGDMSDPQLKAAYEEALKMIQ